MKPAQSIISGAIARDLIADTQPRKGLVVGRREATAGIPIDWTFRLCTFNMSRPTKANPWQRVTKVSGGAVLEGKLTRKYQHAPGLGVRSMIRLKPGWNEATVSRAVHRMHRALMDADPLRQMREKVFQTWEPIREQGVDVEPFVATGEAAEHTAEYEQMTAEDCAYWLDLARTVKAEGGA